MAHMNKRALRGLRAWREKNKGVKIIRMSPLERGFNKPRSPMQCIKAKCWDCQDGGPGSNTREAIRDCNAFLICPLWPLRPYQKIKDKKGEVNE